MACLSNSEFVEADFEAYFKSLSMHNCWDAWYPNDTKPHIVFIVINTTNLYQIGLVTNPSISVYSIQHMLLNGCIKYQVWNTIVISLLMVLWLPILLMERWCFFEQDGKDDVTIQPMPLMQDQFKGTPLRRTWTNLHI
jgi:hypothetical protein